MKRNQRFSLIMGIGSAIIIAIILISSPPVSREDEIQAAIDEANFCTDASECELVGSVCPFDCYIYVNRTKAGEIKELLSGYQSTCAYSCIACQDVACESGKCQAVCN